MLLSAAAITKSFAGVRALKGVSFDLRPGEVHALVGENGAGKSTLIKIITGAETPDRGELIVHGQRRDRDGPRPLPRARHRRHLPAAVALPGPHRRREHRPGARDRRPVAAARLVATRQPAPPSCSQRIGASIDPARLVETLSMPEQQIVEIAKAIGADAKIVIMDEPTASLTEREVESLFRVIALLKTHGVGIVYISHRLEEVFAIADRITVLRDGETVGTLRARRDRSRRLITLMVGPRALGGLSETGRSRSARSRSRCGTCRTGRPASPTCRCRSARARSSASPDSSGPGARSWRRSSSG